MISIVLPTRNGARFLRESVESCLSQSVRELELVAVDDGSTDATPGILAQLASADPRIRVLRHAVSQGLPAALNAGFAVARGDLLTWTSDDNVYRPTALERLSCFLIERPEVDVVYSDCTVIDQAGANLGVRVVQPADSLPRGNGIGACFLYRRRVHEALAGYDVSTFRAEDYDFWLRAWLCGFRMEPLHEDLYLYRVHAGALSAMPSGTEPSAAEKVVLRHAPRMARGARALAILQVRDLALRRGDSAAARRLLWKALALSPVKAVRRLGGGLIRRNVPVPA